MLDLWEEWQKNNPDSKPSEIDFDWADLLLQTKGYCCVMPHSLRRRTIKGNNSPIAVVAAEIKLMETRYGVECFVVKQEIIQLLKCLPLFWNFAAPARLNSRVKEWELGLH